MSISRAKIHLGYEVGTAQEVSANLTHTIVAAQTRYGKSTTIRTMMESVPDGYRILCLDVKDPRDFEGAGAEIPIFIENKTDPLMLKRLLEQESKIWLRQEFPELIDVCRNAQTYDEVYNEVKSELKKKNHPVKQNRLKVIGHLLERLINDMKEVDISRYLHLPARVNVMDLHDVPHSIKQLAVHSSVKEVMDNQTNTIIVLDELPDFAPQGKPTPSKEVLAEAVRKGGAKEIWLWLSGQTMTGVEKEVLKQCDTWILGHQKELNEAKRTVDQIPFKTGLNVKDVMVLQRGHFIVVKEDRAIFTYVQPPFVDDDTAKDVALGKMDVGNIVTASPWEDSPVEEERETVPPYRVMELEKRVEAIEETLSSIEDTLSGLLEGSGDDISLITLQSTLNIKVTRRQIDLTTETLEGRIAWLYAEGFFDINERSTTDVNREMKRRGYPVDPRLGGKLDDLCQWGFLRKRRSDKNYYQAVITSEEAEKRGLLNREIEVIPSKRGRR